VSPRPGPIDADDPRVTGEMPFLEHLEELRWVLMHSLIACVLGAIGGWLLAPRVLEDVIARTVKHAVVLSPLEAFNERFKLSLIIGFFIAAPIVFYRVWSFIVPGLFKRERTWVLPMAMASLLLFALGAWAAYGYVVPMVVQVLSGFMTPNMTAEIRLGSLLDFVYNMALACGLVCQLPLVTMTLTAIGLVTPGFLLKQWRYAIVLTFFVTAIITPGDVVTAQIVMGVPMTALYFVSVGLSYFVARRKAQAETAAKEQHVPQS
jgi:sec-independent protein translocase protein TatC